MNKDKTEEELNVPHGTIAIEIYAEQTKKIMEYILDAETAWAKQYYQFMVQKGRDHTYEEGKILGTYEALHFVKNNIFNILGIKE